MKRTLIILLTFAAIVATAQTRRSRVDYLDVRLKPDPATTIGTGVLFYDNTDSTFKVRNPNGSITVLSYSGNDTIWTQSGSSVFLTDSTNNVGIGTTAPVAKLHVSISDTTGIEIAHFENNLYHAIMALHSHADSSAIIFFQSNGYGAGIGIEGITKELRVLNGMGAIAIAIDTSNNITIPDLAGSAQKLVIALADGTLDTVNGAVFTLEDGYAGFESYHNMFVGTGYAGGGAGNFVAGDSSVSNIDTSGGIGTAWFNTIVGNRNLLATPFDGASNTVFGFGNTTLSGNTIVGYGNSVTGQSNVVIGNAGEVAGEENIIINGATNAGNGNILLYSDIQPGSAAIGTIGLNATNITISHAFIAGTTTGSKYIDNVYFGNGVRSGTPQNITYNATGAEGTNTAGATITIAAGKGTGNASTNGYISLSTPDAGASGTTLQTLSEKVRITKSGDILLINAANGLILKDAAGTPHYWRVTISTLGVLTTTDLGTTIPN